MTALKLALPSKGRLQEDAINWFDQFGINVTRTGSGREYAGRVDGIDNVELVLLSAGEVPRELAAGRIHLGVTGEDLIQERIPGWQSRVEKIAPMGFGFADLIIAVPKAWIDVETVSDLDAVAAQFRAEHGFRLRIATKYHNLLREFLRDRGVADYQLVDSQGATEGTVANLTAEAVADITSSGETLRANHLRILEDALVLKSQACVFRSESAEWSPEATDALNELTARIRAAK